MKFKNWEVIHWDYLDVTKELISKGEKFHLVLIDPPYEVQSNGGGSVNKIKKLNKSLNEWIVKDDIVSGYDYEKTFDILDKLQDNINICFFCSKKQIMTYLNRYVNEKKCTFDIILWHKNNALPTYSNKYLSDCEYILHFRKWASCKPENYKDAQTVYFWSINHKDKKLHGHPTIKPIELVEKLIRNHSKPWDKVLDFFAWSWTTWVGCQNTWRKFVLVEKAQKYYELSCNRVSDNEKRIINND